MASDIVFETGDLIEYTRPMKGRPGLPEEMTLRAIVMGFEVQRDVRTDELSTSIRLYEGSIQIGEPESDEIAGVSVETTEVKQDKEPELVCFDLDYILSLDPEVIRKTNSLRSLSIFDIL